MKDSRKDRKCSIDEISDSDRETDHSTGHTQKKEFIFCILSGSKVQSQRPEMNRGWIQGNTRMSNGRLFREKESTHFLDIKHSVLKRSSEKETKQRKAQFLSSHTFRVREPPNAVKSVCVRVD